MPELAEAEFFRKRWHQAAVGRRVTAVLTHDGAKVFRGMKPAALRRALADAGFLGSEAAAKQMLFRFSGGAWLGVHLGMSGELRVEPAAYMPLRHDHLVLRLARGPALVFTDPRMFGRVQLHLGAEPPAWWTRIAPAILSPAFTFEAVAAFLRRRARAPIKAVLLMQERFPGVGNWMADEILWRAAIHPKRLAGLLRPAEARALARMPPRRPARARHHRRARRLSAARPQRAHPRHLAVSAPLGSRWALPENQKAACPRGGRRSHDLLVTRAAETPPSQKLICYHGVHGWSRMTESISYPCYSVSSVVNSDSDLLPLP